MIPGPHDTTTGLVGVVARPFQAHRDARGSFAEIHRDAWGGDPVVQWNLVHTVRGGMRGVHLHLVHTDTYVVAAGAARVGLHDVREGSPSVGRSAVLDLRAADDVALRIPPGIAHGVLALADCLLVVGVDRYYDPADDLGCRWDDPDLGIDWRFDGPVLLSDRDAGAPPFVTLRSAWAARAGRPDAVVVDLTAASAPAAP